MISHEIGGILPVPSPQALPYPPSLSSHTTTIVYIGYTPPLHPRSDEDGERGAGAVSEHRSRPPRCAQDQPVRSARVLDRSAS